MRKFNDTYIKSLKAKANRYEEYEGGGIKVISLNVQPEI